MTPPTADPVRLCALADMLLLTRDMFRPSEQAVASLRGVEESLDDLLAAAGARSDSPLAHALRRVTDTSRTTDLDAWRDEYHRLFEGATLCPLNQTAYVRRDKGAILGDLCGFYRAFGFAPSNADGEKPDHLRTELEFMAVLLVMLVQARGESGPITRHAIKSLGGDHLGEWIAGVWQRLALVTLLPYHAAVADALREIWTHLANELDLPPVQMASPDDVDPEPENPYECGMVPSAESVSVRVRGEPIA
ncbi:MAG: molecular chaperone TorD family protein [Phycisphaeraceae bacterium]|nr:molecular chaperone TorD family protein [Phycisphaeraceae bacterium]